MVATERHQNEDTPLSRVGDLAVLDRKRQTETERKKGHGAERGNSFFRFQDSEVGRTQQMNRKTQCTESLS